MATEQGKVQIIVEAIDNASGVFSKLGMALTATGLIAGLGALVKSAAQYGDELDRLSTITGISTENLSKMSYAAKHLDVDQGTLIQSLGFLSRNMLSASEGNSVMQQHFKDMGITVTDASGHLKNANDILNEMADFMKNSGANSTEKMALAMDVLGRSGKNMLPYLLAGSDQIKKLGDEAEAFGLVISGDTAKQLDELNHSMMKMKDQVMGFALALTHDLSPAIGVILKLFKDFIIVSAEIIKTFENFGEAIAWVTGNYDKNTTAAAKWNTTQKDTYATLINQYADVERQLKQQDLSNLKYIQLTEKATELKKAIDMLTPTVIAEANAVTVSVVAHHSIAGEIDAWMKQVNDMTYDTLPKNQKEWNDWAGTVVVANQALIKDRDSLTGMGQVNKQTTDGLKQMASQQNTNNKMTDAAAAAWINMAHQILQSGATIKNTFDIVENGLAQMVGATNPILGAAMELGGSIIDKLFWGNKAKDKAQWIDENLKVINDYLASIKLKWGQFAVDIASTISSSLQLPTITDTLVDFGTQIKNTIKKAIGDQLITALLNSPVYKQSMQNITENISTIGSEAQSGYTAVDMLGWGRVLQQDITSLVAAMAPMISVFKGVFTGLDAIPAMAGGGIVLPKPGGTLIRVAEAGQAEMITPLGSAGGGMTVNFNGGMFLGTRAEIDTVFRKYLLPALNNYNSKVGA